MSTCTRCGCCEVRIRRKAKEYDRMHGSGMQVCAACVLRAACAWRGVRARYSCSCGEVFCGVVGE